MTQLIQSCRTVSALVALTTLVVRSPARVDTQSPMFKGGVDMVPLTVTVTDKRGKFVTGLTGRDFAVYENGVEQPLSFFANESVPLDVALVLDTSNSMGAELALVQSAACGLIRTLRASDRGAVMEVKNFARIPQPFTSDRVSIERAIHGLSTSGATALYDGLYVVLKEFERERRATTQVRRQALVLLSDGLDNKSHLSFEDVVDLARRVAVNIYVIALRGDAAFVPREQKDSSSLEAEYTMGTVARETGGRTFFPELARELPAIYTSIAQELANQYELGYTPMQPPTDGTFRRVAVRVPRINAFARTRSGYYAARPTMRR